MTFLGILTVLWYSITPWLWLIGLLSLLLLISVYCGWIKKIKPLKHVAVLGTLIPVGCALAALFVIPLHTQSTIAYVNTWVDWLSLLAAAVAVCIFSWILLKPLR